VKNSVHSEKSGSLRKIKFPIQDKSRL